MNSGLLSFQYYTPVPPFISADGNLFIFFSIDCTFFYILPDVLYSAFLFFFQILQKGSHNVHFCLPQVCVHFRNVVIFSLREFMSGNHSY